MNDRLIKLLNLTQSANDHEALAAVRQANAMLKKAGKQWSDVVGAQEPGSMNFMEDMFSGLNDIINRTAAAANNVRSTERGRRTRILDMITSLRARGMNHGWMTVLHAQANNPKVVIDPDLERTLEQTYAAAPRGR